MKITANVQNAFSRKAGAGIELVRIEETGHETKFVVRVARINRTITVGCGRFVTAADAERAAERAAAYATSVWGKPEAVHGHR